MSNSGKSLVTVKNLSSGYGKQRILSDISFELKANEVVGLLGANGCGKTTLIKALCRIIPSEGEVVFDGVNGASLSARLFAKHCSLVPQKSGIGIDIRVLDVVLMGFNPFLSILEKPSRAMISKAEEILGLFGLRDREFDNFLNLSEGQKQLVIIARALVANTNVLFMDEPESSLDFAVRYDMMDTLKKQIVGQDKCALVSLHDINLALRFCDKLLLIKDGKISSEIDINHEDVGSIEQKLQEIYGSIRLLAVASETGASETGASGSGRSESVMSESGRESLIVVKA